MAAASPCSKPWLGAAIGLGTAGIALLLAACFVVTDAATSVAQELPSPAGATSQAKLPLSEVVLYSSGVGYFQRNGQVQGASAVELRFKVDSINDLLKSLVVQDLDGGRVTTVTYGSRDPITKTLKSFGIDLTTNPTLGELLGQIRGEQIEAATPNVVVGTILGVEKKQEPAGNDKTVEVEFLNILTQEGLRSVPMNQVQRIKLLNEQLNSELRQALDVLAAGHDTQKKTVVIRFEGEGDRRVSIAYIMETPVWKTSYRLVLDDDAQPFLQGWAIVENTTDDDWSGVQLSLVSGRPISFIMDMYQPLYVTRPLVVPELYAALRPQVYGEAMEEQRLAERSLARKEAAAPAMPAGGAVGGAAAQARRMRGAGVAADALAAGDVARQELDLKQGVAASAQAGGVGELFQYVIRTPVTLHRQKSAMLPIVSQDVEGQKVSIYNQAVQPKYPLNGFRLKNTSTLHLMQGPITVFDGGSYAGDARIEDLAPGQDRLISYAMDLRAEVEPVVSEPSAELVSVQVRKGTLIATRKANESKTYNVKNRDSKKKLVLIEHPYRQDWELVEPSEPTERTRDVYRFAVPLEPEKGARLAVVEQKQLQEHVQLLNSGSDVIAFYLRAPKVSVKVKEALQKLVALRDRLSQTAAERGRREQRVSEITQEQTRIRENMARLQQNSELYNRYVKKLDQQETEIDDLRTEIETLKAQEAKQQMELNDYLLNLDVD